MDPPVSGSAGNLLERRIPRRSLAYVALVLGILCIGFSAIFVKFANISGPASAFYRVAIAATVILPWWLLRGKRTATQADILWTAAGGILFALDLVLWNTSLLYTSAATATVLANNAPLWVGLASFALLRERLPLYFWLGLAIALLGMSILVGTDAWRTMRFNKGDVMAIAASIFYAAYLLTTQRARARIDTITFMSISIATSLSALLGINLITGTELTGYPLGTWGALLGLGLVSHLGGWLAINFALGHLRAAPVSVTLLGQAIVTALLSIPLLGEFLTIPQIVGGLLALAGIALANRGGSPQKRVPRTDRRGT